MPFKKLLVTAVLLFVVILFQQCAKSGDTTVNPVTVPQPSLPATPYNYNVAFPAHIQNALLLNDKTPAGNAISNDGATLGRVLFYDKHLSKNNTVSCGSCHKPATSFSDDAQFSKGFEGGLTSRHSMALLYVRFYKSG